MVVQNLMAVTDAPSRSCQPDRMLGTSRLKDRFVHALRTLQSTPAQAAVLRKLRSSHAPRSNHIMFGDQPDLYIFECRACGVSHVEAAYIEAV